MSGRCGIHALRLLAPALAGLGAGLGLSCSPGNLPPASPEVEVSGCWTVSRAGPVCGFRPKPEPQLRLWVRAGPGTEVEIEADGRLLRGSGEEEGGGRRYAVTLDPGDSRLSVRLRAADGTRGPPWSLRLARTDRPAWLDEIKELESAGRTEEIRRRLTELRHTVPQSERGMVLRMLAHLARQAGDGAAYEAYLNQGIAVDRAVGCASCETVKKTQLVGHHLAHGRFAQARQTLETLPPPVSAEDKYLGAYYRGLLADAVGDYRTALAELRRAQDLARRLDLHKYLWDAEQVLARLLQGVGRSREATELFAHLRAEANPDWVHPCDLGDLLNNLGWIQLLAREAGEPAADPTPVLEQAHAELKRHGCPPERRLNPLLNLAFAHLQAGRWPAARQALDLAREARRLGAQPGLRDLLWWDDLEGRAALAEGRPDRALALYRQLAARAEPALVPEGLLRAWLGQARARLALGDRAAALAALAAADRQIDEQSWQIPAHEGRDTFVAQREAVTRLHLELLLDDGQVASAFALARRARTRLLRQLTVADRLTQLSPEEQQSWDGALSSYRTLLADLDRQAAGEWQLPGDRRQRAREERAAQLAAARDALDRALAALGAPGEGPLSPPGREEVVLAYHPLSAGWAGFAATAQGVEVSHFELPAGRRPDPDRLARLLLQPLHRSVAGAARVRVLPYGRLRAVDFHLLPFDGAPLLARRQVVYSLDLPVRSAPSPPHRPLALLVADPQEDLPAARRESALVDAAVRAWEAGWRSRRLEGEAARAGAVRAALPGAGLFHYAGHGVFAGFAGWDSALPLAEGSRLTLGDVLSLRPAPAWVVLSACDAGRSSEQAPGEGIGLAHAFLLAGAQGVVAAGRPVADTIAHDLMRELYRGWQPGGDLPRRLQDAQLALRRRGVAASAWGSFRLLVP